MYIKLSISLCSTAILIGLLFRFRFFVHKALSENGIVKTLKHPIVTTFLPTVVGFYYLVLDVWGNDWSLISDYKAYHQKVFIILVSISLIILFIKSITEVNQDKYRQFLEGYTILASKSVNMKLRRFKDKAKLIRPKVNIFKLITQPKDQITLILNEFEHLLRSSFGIPEGNNCISILGKSNTTNWHYFVHTKDAWEHTKAPKIITSNSAAARALSMGEHIFFPDKKKAAAEGKYFFSERDTRKGNGSIFCYPVNVEMNGYTDNYIISITTYGEHFLCNPIDLYGIKSCETIFSDICRRIELELTLHSIKNWQNFSFDADKLLTREGA